MNFTIENSYNKHATIADNVYNEIKKIKIKPKL